MKMVREVLSSKPWQLFSIAPTATVYEALVVMSQYEVGALVVLDDRRLVGMLSERDYARKVVLLGRSSRDLRVFEVMASPVVHVVPGDTVEACMRLMTDNRVRHLPVVDGATVVGLVSIGDVVKAMLDEQRFVIEQLEHYIAT